MRRRATTAACIPIACYLIACGNPDPETPAAAQPGDPAPIEEATPAPIDPEDAAAATTAPESEEAAIDAADLVHGGSVEIKEYSVAFIGSGSLGKGTLRVGASAHPFRIGGLGIGGIGVASIDARGNVYNLHNLADFPGAYGKARVGVTAADAGKGKLWLKNTKGVVLELSSDMQGLALTLGVDGIVVQWEADYQSGLKDVGDGTKQAWEGTKQGTRKAMDAVKKPFE